MAETEASQQYRADREEELRHLQEYAESERRWANMESSRKARVMAIAKMMGGEKAKKFQSRRRKVHSGDVRRLAKGAKVALRDYATWSRDHRDELNAHQIECLSSLLREWGQVQLKAVGDNVKFCPPHDRLRELHQSFARSGAGDFESWTRYVAAVREVEKVTQPKSGLPRKQTKEEGDDIEEEDDEAYVDSRQLVNIEDINDVLQSQWNLDKEKEARVEEEKLRTETAAKIKAGEDAATKRRLETREKERMLLDESPSMDEDGFVVVEDETPETFDRPAVLDGFSWTDDKTTATVYVELSRPVRTNELDVTITRTSVEVSHKGSLVIKRSFWRPVADKDEDTLWFLEDSGDILRFELVKAKYLSSDENDTQLWRCIFDGGGGRRSTRGQDQRLEWSQSEYDLTLTARVPSGTTKNDIKITLRRDSIKIYVKASGILVDGTLNRSISVKDCTWVLSSNELTVMLAKLHKKQPWQRLIADGNEISIEDAHRQMGSEPPEHGDLSYDELDPHEQLYAEALREYRRAEGRGDRELARDILNEIDANLPMVLHADPQRKMRSRLEKEGFS